MENEKKEVDFFFPAKLHAFKRGEWNFNVAIQMFV